MDLHVERYDWTLYLVFVSVVALECFGWLWHILAIVSCTDESCRVSRPKSRKFVDGFDGLSGCLKFSRL